MKRSTIWQVAFSLSIASLSVWGCTPAATPPVTVVTNTDHADEAGHNHGDEAGHAEHHAHPKTLAEGLPELQELQFAIKAGLTGDDAEAAHGPLHEVFHLLQDFESLCKNLPEAQSQEATRAVESLFDSYGKLDEVMHKGEKPDYNTVGENIDAAVKALQDLAAIGDATK